MAVGSRTTRRAQSVRAVIPARAKAILGITRTTATVRVVAPTRAARTVIPTTRPVATGIAPVVVRTPIRTLQRCVSATLASTVV